MDEIEKAVEHELMGLAMGQTTYDRAKPAIMGVITDALGDALAEERRLTAALEEAKRERDEAVKRANEDWHDTWRKWFDERDDTAKLLEAERHANRSLGILVREAESSLARARDEALEEAALRVDRMRLDMDRDNPEEVYAAQCYYAAREAIRALKKGGDRSLLPRPDAEGAK
jgi:signal transduction protein with GAF and PtsI domain